MINSSTDNSNIQIILIDSAEMYMKEENKSNKWWKSSHKTTTVENAAINEVSVAKKSHTYTHTLKKKQSQT